MIWGARGATEARGRRGGGTGGRRRASERYHERHISSTRRQRGTLPCEHDFPRPPPTPPGLYVRGSTNPPPYAIAILRPVNPSTGEAETVVVGVRVARLVAI